MTECTFRNRQDAGRALSGLLESYADRDDVLVLALPRGGVQVAYELAVAFLKRVDPDAAAPPANATRGELNVGQLIREHHPGECRLIASRPSLAPSPPPTTEGAPADRKVVRPALRDSVEDLFHHVRGKEFLLGSTYMEDDVMRTARLERAIGVVYRPQTEWQSHYFRTRVANRFDAVIHIDETRAVEPLERTSSPQ